jgi:tetratricopeptide (TPR) repeat protein
MASPFLLLGLLELGLRLAGWGYPTSFFLRASHDGRAVLIENPKFGWRFFPPAVARSPQPLCIAAEKPPGMLRIFLLGESAAMGDPEPAYGFGRQLERLLQARHPDRHIEVANVAMTAINSHVIREIARDCTARAGDCWIIYAGNNEVIGPFGAGTVFGRQAPGLAWVRVNLALKKTRVGQLLDRGFRPSGPAKWGGMEMFLDQQVRRDDPRLNTVYHHFAKNLSAIIQAGKESGGKVLVSTMAVDLKDSPPFASQHRPGLSAAEQTQFEQCLARSRHAESQGQQADALAAYTQAARIDPDYAELAFRRARCELAQGQASSTQADAFRLPPEGPAPGTQGQASAARADAQLACDLDTLRFRADSRLNEIIRQTATAQGVRLIDAEQELARRSNAGVPGAELFYDHVHLNFSGNYALAALFVPEVERAFFGKAGESPQSTVHGPQSTVDSPQSTVSSLPLLAEAEVARRLGFTDFDRRRVLEEMRMRFRQPPFVSQSNFQERDGRLGRALAAPPVPPADLVPGYRAALALAPDDPVLRANFGRLLEAAGDGPGAEAQWKEVVRLVPHEPDAWFRLGDLEHSAGHLAAAARLFREALARSPSSAEALNGLGLVLAAQGKNAEAIRRFETASRADPRFTAARVNLAVVLAGQGDISGAAALYRLVLGLDTNNLSARINLAKLLAGQGKAGEAIALYTQALELQPDNALAHYDLANAFAAQGRGDEALAHYTAAVQSRPDFTEARYNLALELTRLGKVPDALVQFAEVVRLKPDLAEARYNYGVALARARRYPEAVRQFQETLNRQPDNPAARSALDRALQLEKGQSP